MLAKKIECWLLATTANQCGQNPVRMSTPKKGFFGINSVMLRPPPAEAITIIPFQRLNSSSDCGVLLILSGTLIVSNLLLHNST